MRASTAKKTVVIECGGSCPTAGELNTIFSNDGYSFSSKPFVDDVPLFQFKKDGELVINQNKLFSGLINLLLASGVLLLLWLINRSGLSSLITPNASSSLLLFFFFGLIAGSSSCAALSGGIILSMSKQWQAWTQKKGKKTAKWEPHVLFNAGRIASFFLAGALLGVLGHSARTLPLHFYAVFTIAISLLMIVLGLQMLGVKQLQSLRIGLPRSLSKIGAKDPTMSNRVVPVLTGALTLLLPCGFTITTMTIALTTANILQASLIMTAFALGTAPMLLAIGLSSSELLTKPRLAQRFMIVAGILVVAFGLNNIRYQLRVLGINAPIVTSASIPASNSKLPPIVDGVQIIKLNAYSNRYDPNQITVRVGVPVRWEITDQGTSGCTNAIIAPGLFNGEIRLSPGETSIKEFTVTKPGRYTFSCWMGMVEGIIEAVQTSE